MTGPFVVGALIVVLAIGQHVADRRFYDDLARLLTAAACVLLLALLVYAVGELAL